jgi:hypothetical protein
MIDAKYLGRYFLLPVTSPGSNSSASSPPLIAFLVESLKYAKPCLLSVTPLVKEFIGSKSVKFQASPCKTIEFFIFLRSTQI